MPARHEHMEPVTLDSFEIPLAQWHMFAQQPHDVGNLSTPAAMYFPLPFDRTNQSMPSDLTNHDTKNAITLLSCLYEQTLGFSHVMYPSSHTHS